MMVATSTESAETIRRRLRLFSVLVLAVVVAYYLELPFRMAAFGFGAAAVWYGLQTLLAIGRARRLGAAVPGQLAVSAGLGLTLVLLTELFGQALLYPLYAEQQSCLRRAATITAERECTEAFDQRRREILERVWRREGR